eukprot:scaffold188927_cov24-Attheya_sp.AAC.1
MVLLIAHKLTQLTEKRGDNSGRRTQIAKNRPALEPQERDATHRLSQTISKFIRYTGLKRGDNSGGISRIAMIRQGFEPQ